MYSRKFEGVRKFCMRNQSYKIVYGLKLLIILNKIENFKFQQQNNCHQNQFESENCKIVIKNQGKNPYQKKKIYHKIEIFDSKCFLKKNS
jgi:hypothetical protein